MYASTGPRVQAHEEVIHMRPTRREDVYVVVRKQ